MLCLMTCNMTPIPLVPSHHIAPRFLPGDHPSPPRFALTLTPVANSATVKEAISNKRTLRSFCEASFGYSNTLWARLKRSGFFFTCTWKSCLFECLFVNVHAPLAVHWMKAYRRTSDKTESNISAVISDTLPVHADWLSEHFRFIVALDEGEVKLIVNTWSGECSHSVKITICLLLQCKGIRQAAEQVRDHRLNLSGDIRGKERRGWEETQQAR